MTSSLQTPIGHGQGTTKVPQANWPQNQIETGWKSAWEGAHRSLSVRQKLRNIRNCSRRRREGHNSREDLQFINSLSRRESYQEKTNLPSQIPEGGLMQRIKDRRLKILQHLQRSQEGGVTDLASASTRQVVKHLGGRNFRQHRAEDCRNHRPIPQNCGYRQIRCPKLEENIRKIGKRRPIDGMAFRGTPPPINGPFSMVPHTRRKAPNQSRLFSHMPGETE